MLYRRMKDCFRFLLQNHTLDSYFKTILLFIGLGNWSHLVAHVPQEILKDN